MMSTFEELGIAPDLMKGIKDLGFTEPMPVQAETIPVILNTPDDLVGLAQTGTGKTAAFGLPMVQMVDALDKSTQGLILAPTRELCLQISGNMNNFSKYLPHLNIVTVYG